MPKVDVEEHRKESVSELSQMLVYGIQGIAAFTIMRPILMGEPGMFRYGLTGAVVDNAFPVMDWLDWPFIGAGVCFIALAWQLSKRVPRKVTQRAYRAGVMEDTNWKDVSWTPGVSEPERRKSAY